MATQFPLLCPLSPTSKLNFNTSKTVYCFCTSNLTKRFIKNARTKLLFQISCCIRLLASCFNNFYFSFKSHKTAEALQFSLLMGIKLSICIRVRVRVRV